MRADALALGVALAYARLFHPAALAMAMRRPSALTVLGLVALSPRFVLGTDIHFAHTHGYALEALGMGCLLLATLEIPGSAFASGAGRLLAGTGVYSYAIYLWHGDLVLYPMHSLMPSGPWAWLVGLFATLALSTAAGVAMTLLIDRPATALRNRWFPSQTRSIIHKTTYIKIKK